SWHGGKNTVVLVHGTRCVFKFVSVEISTADGHEGGTGIKYAGTTHGRHAPHVHKHARSHSRTRLHTQGRLSSHS
ncbi:hypothetical protein J6590_071518, partial [Homalodisca vitripennis]